MAHAREHRRAAGTLLIAEIDALVRAAPAMTPVRLALATDQLRREALLHGFDAVAALAHGLESALAQSRGSAIARPYLEAMVDAAATDREPPAEPLLALVTSRLHG